MPEKNSNPPTVGKLAQLMAARNMEEKAIAGLEDCLNATITMKDEDGKLHTMPDFKTILGAITLALAYTAGKPVERREVITRHSTSLDELRKMRQSSPELKKAIEELMQDEKPVKQIASS